jgi:hypothetical protein
MVPLGVALLASGILRGLATSRPAWHAAALIAALAVAGAHLGDVMWRRHLDPRPPADSYIANQGAWLEACDWIARETPPDALFLTPRLAQTFRWYANRAEVANRKDIPQDAAGIVEWRRRNQRLHAAAPGAPAEWRESLAALGSRRVRELGAEFGADYVITAAYPPLDLERVGPSSASFVIYRFPSVDKTKSPALAAEPAASLLPVQQPSYHTASDVRDDSKRPAPRRDSSAP